MGKIGGNYLTTPDALREIDSRDNQKLNLYQIGVEYLKKNIPCLNDEDNWKSFESSYFVAPNYSSLENAFFEVPNSMKSQRRGNYIQYNINEDTILKILHGDSHKKTCDYKYVRETYGDDDKKLRDDLQKAIGFKIENDNENRNSWVIFAKSICKSAAFRSRFDNVNQLITYCSKDTSSERLNLAKSITKQQGAGAHTLVITLNWLKDIGIPGYCKPDLHLCRILTGIFKEEFLKKGSPYTTVSAEDWSKKLQEKEKVQKDVFIKAIEQASSDSADLFAFDRLLYLIGSGDFYGSDALSQRMRTEYAESVRGADKDERFIIYALSHL